MYVGRVVKAGAGNSLSVSIQDTGVLLSPMSLPPLEEGSQYPIFGAVGRLGFTAQGTGLSPAASRGIGIFLLETELQIKQA